MQWIQKSSVVWNQIQLDLANPPMKQVMIIWTHGAIPLQWRQNVKVLVNKDSRMTLLEVADQFSIGKASAHEKSRYEQGRC